MDWFDGFGPFDNIPSSAMIELIANRGGFLIGGPHGDFMLGRASRYATDSGFNTSFPPDTTNSPAEAKQKPNKMKREESRTLTPAATDNGELVATAIHGAGLDRPLVIPWSTFNLFSDLTTMATAALEREQWESRLVHDDLTDGKAFRVSTNGGWAGNLQVRALETARPGRGAD